MSTKQNCLQTTKSNDIQEDKRFLVIDDAMMNKENGIPPKSTKDYTKLSKNENQLISNTKDTLLSKSENHLISETQIVNESTNKKSKTKRSASKQKSKKKHAKCEPSTPQIAKSTRPWWAKAPEDVWIPGDDFEDLGIRITQVDVKGIGITIRESDNPNFLN